MAAQLPAPNNRKILITGMNGYIASNLAFYFLTCGYCIGCTVRSAAKSHLILSSPAFTPFISRITVHVIADITHEEAFNEAVKGTYAIFHLATPINFWSSTKKEVVDPAVKGTLDLLEAAQKHAGSQLKTLIYMSSLAALLESENSGSHHYIVESWNTTAELAVSGLSHDEEAPFGILYPASKIFAERVVLNYHDTLNPAFRLLSVVPAMVIGPPILFPERVEDINGTIKPIWEALSGECTGMPRKVGSGMFVNVRDLVEFCGGLTEREERVRKRFVIVGGKAQPILMVRALFGRYPERLGHLKILLDGDVDGTKDVGPTFDTEEVEVILGRPWIGYEKSVLDTAEVLARYLS
jgi:nucleoside-diphosphate-sugar epimerase